MEIIYFTITGTNHYFGHEFCETGMRVRLVKEPDNEFDKEAIRVEMPGLGKVGYVANSSYTTKQSLAIHIAPAESMTKSVKLPKA